MTLADIYLVSDKLALASDDAVDQLEATIGIPLPPGYREYATTLGAGEYCNELLVDMPEKVLEHLSEYRIMHSSMFGENYADPAALPLGQEDVDECVQLAGTYNGDCVIICPQHPGKVFLLPDDEQEIQEIDTGFLVPERLCFGGNWQPQFAYFEAETDQRHPHSFRYRTLSKGRDVATLLQREYGDDVHVYPTGDDDNRLLVLVKALAARFLVTTGEEQINITVVLDDDCVDELHGFLDSARATLELVDYRPPTVEIPAAPEPKVTLKAGGRPRMIAETFAVGPVRVHEPQKANKVRLAAANFQSNVAFSADARRLAGVGCQSLSLWDVRTQATLSGKHVHTGWISDAVFSPDGKWLATAGGASDGVIKLWDVLSHEELLTLPGHAFSGTKCLAFSRESTNLISGGYDGRVRLWNISSSDGMVSGEEVEVRFGNIPKTASLGTVFYSQDDQPIAVRSDERRTVTWNVATGKQYRVLETGDSRSLVLVAPHHCRVLTVGTRSAVDIWDLSSGELTCRIELQAHTRVVCGAFHPAGGHVAIGMDGGGVRVWDLDEAREVGQLEQHEYPVKNVAFSKDGSHFAATCGDRVLVWTWDAMGRAESDR